MSAASEEITASVVQLSDIAQNTADNTQNVVQYGGVTCYNERFEKRKQSFTKHVPAIEGTNSTI